ncbi:hypothetical protein [uncultured Limnohabitans sp.]|uniref:hypothetical protein n=1 Tax=uncultured Limnohabitans sp. TaxID=768543 RepID=UPI00261DD60B|nr:hypothetical protein [uncultured Limnohabitans sp.]
MSEARGGRAKTTRLGDAFAEGWVAGIDKLVADFANPEPVEAAIGEYVEQKAAGKSAPTREPKRSEAGFYAAAMQGLKAASGESIYRPMEAQGPKQAIEHGSNAN